MAKEAGLAWTTFTIGGNDVRTDVTSLDIATPRDTQEVTGIDKSAKERLLLLADGSVDIKYVYDDAGGKIYATLKDVATTTTSKATSIGVSGQTLAMNLLWEDFQINRGDDGSLTGKSTGELADGTAPAWS